MRRFGILLLVFCTCFALAAWPQNPAVTHNAWSSGAPIPTGVASPAAAVLQKQIYVIGGQTGYFKGIMSDVQIYNPATNTWTSGVPFPTPITWASAAVVKGVLYVFGGTTDFVNATDTVYAYSPKKGWATKSAMPIARADTVAVVEDNIVYVIGGLNGSGWSDALAIVESYNPETDTWTEEQPMYGPKFNPAAGLLKTTIVVADGAVAPSVITGDTEAYNAATDTWMELTADPTPRTGSCFGSISSNLYDAGGFLNNGYGGAAATVNEKFNLSNNTWTPPLAAMPQGTMWSASAVYGGRLYCIGGWEVAGGPSINNVQIYQP